MTRRAGALAASAATAAAVAALAAPAGAAQNETQRFFAEKLIADPGTSQAIRDLLRTGGGFVDRSVSFRDLTGDEKADAVVRVQSGGAAGAVAVYVFSTDTGEPDAELTIVFASQRLRRGSDEHPRRRADLPQPHARSPATSRAARPGWSRRRLRWDAQDHRLRVDERREIDARSGRA